MYVDDTKFNTFKPRFQCWRNVEVPEIKPLAGISSLTRWGSTVCRLPTFSKLNLSFVELVKKTQERISVMFGLGSGHVKDLDCSFGAFAAYLSTEFAEG